MNFWDGWFGNRKTGENVSPVVLNKILDAMRESVIVVGADTRVLSSNQAAYQAFGRKNGVFAGKRLSEVIRDLTLHEAFQKALDAGASSDVQLEMPGADKRRYDAHVAPIEIGETKGAIGVFYDITQLERLERVRQEFLSNISHELRTPLTSILAFVETLQDGAIEDAENNRRFLAVISRNAERMRRLIDDILELSTIESGSITLSLTQVNLARVTDEIFTNLSGKAKLRGIKLSNEIPENTFVRADVVRLEQMLTNLIDNAVKFNRDGGQVAVNHARKESKDVISVSDTGEGISGEHLQRIFERFYRADRARSGGGGGSSREVGGTGLGLAIVKHLARLHGGEVSVASTAGAGATFSLELPVESA